MPTQYKSDALAGSPAPESREPEGSRARLEESRARLNESRTGLVSQCEHGERRPRSASLNLLILWANTVLGAVS